VLALRNEAAGGRLMAMVHVFFVSLTLDDTKGQPCLDPI
jgi:hypothetical protein